MRIYRNNVKLTMTGLDETRELAEKIHQKSDELMNLVREFDRLRLEMGIDIVRAPDDASIGSKDGNITMNPQALAQAICDRDQGAQEQSCS